jgi:hypothetical protein
MLNCASARGRVISCRNVTIRFPRDKFVAYRNPGDARRAVGVNPLMPAFRIGERWVSTHWRLHFRLMLLKRRQVTFQGVDPIHYEYSAPASFPGPTAPSS